MLIDKEELLATVQADIDLQITGIENVEPVIRCLQTVLDDIKESPAVDLIRCKDCKYYANGGCGINYGIDENGKAVNIRCGENEFCCWAERKEE